jgi:predicted alpha/beta hydrolase
MLSATTFMIVYTPFEIYWSIRDIWYDRWIGLSLKDLEEIDIKISIPDGFLSATLIQHVNIDKVKSRNSIIVICHGFSDTKETLQYFYYPLAFQGYVILVYDARGTGESKKSGKRGNFLKRIEDFDYVVKWIKSNKEYSTLKINSIGFSIGALTIQCLFINKICQNLI